MPLLRKVRKFGRRGENIYLGIIRLSKPILHPVPLSSSHSIHRNLETPIQDENIWDTIMEPSHYSSHMTLTAPPRGLQKPVSTWTPARILAQHAADVTSSSLLPSISTLISSSAMSVPRPITSVVIASSINLPSVYSPVSPFVIATCAELPPPTAKLSLQATLPRPHPFGHRTDHTDTTALCFYNLPAFAVITSSQIAITTPPPPPPPFPSTGP